MKALVLVIPIAAALMLCACSKQTAFEHVTDVYAAQPAQQVSFDVPDGAKELERSTLHARYAPDGGDYALEYCAVSAAEGKDAVRRLTAGEDTDEEQPKMIAHTCVMQDQEYYYCLIFRVKPELEQQYLPVMQDTFASFRFATG